MSDRLVYLDVETTGLDDTVHVPWEIAAIVDDPNDPATSGEWLIQITPTGEDMARADPEALKINGFHERAQAGVGVVVVSSPDGWPIQSGHTWDEWNWAFGRAVVARTLAHVLERATIVGSNPDFDKRMLTALLRDCGHEPAWHYHSYDIRAMVYAHLLARHQLLREQFVPTPETKSGDLFAPFGVSIDPAVAHTALGDARHVRDVWLRLHGVQL